MSLNDEWVTLFHRLEPFRLCPARLISPPLKVRLIVVYDYSLSTPPSFPLVHIKDIENACRCASGSGLESPGGVTEVTVGGKKQRFPDLKGMLMVRFP